MKKLTAVLLSVVMVLALMMPMFTISTSAASVIGANNEWYPRWWKGRLQNPSPDVLGERISDGYKMTEDHPYLPIANQSFVITRVTLKANTAYTLTFDSNVAPSGDSTVFCIRGWNAAKVPDLCAPIVDNQPNTYWSDSGYIANSGDSAYVLFGDYKAAQATAIGDTGLYRYSVTTTTPAGVTDYWFSVRKLTNTGDYDYIKNIKLTCAADRVIGTGTIDFDDTDVAVKNTADGEMGVGTPRGAIKMDATGNNYYDTGSGLAGGAHDWLGLNGIALDPTKSYDVSFKYKAAAGSILYLQPTPTATRSGAYADWPDSNKLAVTDAVTEWTTKKFENFTAFASKPCELKYLWFQMTAGSFQFDDIKIAEHVEKAKASVAVTIEGAGVASAAANIVEEGETVALTAKELVEDSFLGWYNGSTLVSTNKVIDVAYAAGGINYTAKFTPGSASDFDTYAVRMNTVSGGSPANYNSKAQIRTENGNKYYYSGQLTSNDGYPNWALLNDASLNGEADKNQEFVISFKYRVHAQDATFRLMASNTNERDTNNVGWDNIVTLTYNGNETEWRTYTDTITSGSWQTAFATNYWWIQFHNCPVEVDLDDIVVMPYVDTTVDVTASATGCGTVAKSADKIDKGETVTLTANEFVADSFLGWYNGENKVSDEKVLNATYADIKAGATYTAKFEAGFAVDFDNQTARMNVVSGGSPANYNSKSSIKTESGNKFYNTGALTKANDAGYSSWLFLNDFASMNNAATGGKFVVSFKYRVHTAAGVQFNICTSDTTERDTGKTNWSRVELTYDSDETTWRSFSATIDASTSLNNNYWWIQNDYPTGFEATNMDLDDIVITPYVDTAIDVAVSATGCGVATKSAAKVDKGETVTLTAKEFVEGSFLGWYNGATLVSTEKVLNATYADIKAGAAYTAKFKDGSAVDFDNNTARMNTTSGHASYNSKAQIKTENGNKYYYSGQLTSNDGYVNWALLNDTSLASAEKGGKFLVSFKYRVHGQDATFRICPSATNERDTGHMTTNQDFTLTYDSGDETTWRTYSFTYTGHSDINNNFFFIQFFNCPVEVDLDDIVITSAPAIGTAGSTESYFVGNAIRHVDTDVPQALRFKFAISNDVLTGGYNGVALNEFGFLVTSKEAMGSYELTKDSGFAKLSRVAYSTKTGTNIKFSEDANNAYYVAALYNMGGEVDGDINYNGFAKEYVVRAYYTFADGTTLYSDVQRASVFGVFKAILDSTATDAQTLADQEYINEILQDGAANSAYQAWLLG